MTTWEKALIGDVCSLVTDGTHHSPPNHSTGAFRYVTAKNIRPWGLDLKDISYVDVATHQEIYRRCPVEYGDVLYIKDGVTSGLAAINTLNEPFSLLSSVALLKPNRDVLCSAYLKHWLNSPDTKRQMTSGMTGTAIKRLVLKQIRAAEIPIAPLAEQRRIADKLDTVLARVDAVNDRLARVAPLLKRFRQSVLAAATSGTLTEDWRLSRTVGTSWTTAAVADVIEEMRNGLSAKPDEDPTGQRILRISAVRPGALDADDHRYLRSSLGDAKTYSLRAGDVLFTRYNGSLDFVGVCALVRKDLRGYVYPDKLIRVRVRLNRVLPAYFELACNSPLARIQVEGFIKSSAGQKGISGADLKRLQIQVPALDEQTEVVRRVELLFGYADRLEARLQAAQTAAERLTPALLAKAFRGELVPQDPHDEPASELLKRLAVQRAQISSAASPGRGRGRKPTARADHQ